MFRNYISETPFTSEVADKVFKNIHGEAYCGDISFKATLRALIAPRISDDESLTFYVSSSSNCIDGREDKETVEDISTYLDLNEHGAIILHSVVGHKDDNTTCFSRIREQFEGLYSGWHRIDKISALYKKAFNVACFINTDLKSTVIFVDNLDLKKFHYLQCCIPGALPWFFDGDNKVNEDEFLLVDSLRKRDSTDYENCLRKLSTRYDFRSENIKSQLSGFESKFEKIQKENITREIGEIDTRIRNYLDEIGNLNMERNNKCITLMGLENKIEQTGESSEIMEYFLCNKNLYLEEVGSRAITFSVKSQLMYYDEDVISNYLDNPRSLVYTNDYSHGHKINGESMKRLIKAIFLDEKLHINVCGSFTIDLYGRFNANSDHYFGGEFSDCIPNPHINIYGCMGDNVRVINEMMGKHDYIGVIEQCVASVQGINWTDTTVLSRFMQTMYSDDGSKFIELPNGDVVSPYEAVRWLDSEDEKQKEESIDE